MNKGILLLIVVMLFAAVLFLTRPAKSEPFAHADVWALTPQGFALVECWSIAHDASIIYVASREGRIKPEYFAQQYSEAREEVRLTLWKLVKSVYEEPDDQDFMVVGFKYLNSCLSGEL